MSINSPDSQPNRRGGQAASFPAPSSHPDHSADLGERAREVQERIEDGFHEVTERVEDMRGQLREYNDRALLFIRENPALCIAGAVGVGYIVGKLASKRWLS